MTLLKDTWNVKNEHYFKAIIASSGTQLNWYLVVYTLKIKTIYVASKLLELKKNKNELYWFQLNVSMLVHDVTIFYKEFVSKAALYSLFKYFSFQVGIFSHVLVFDVSDYWLLLRWKNWTIFLFSSCLYNTIKASINGA